MAHCTTDMLGAARLVAADVKVAGGQLILSDMYRSYDMQLQAHLDYVTGKKTAFSPSPGGSMHEAGRAFDLDLSALKMKLSDFWKIADKHGLKPIIDTPSAGANEAWHFDCRGSHDLVYKYYASGKGDNFAGPYAAMAASAIVSKGVKVDALGSNPIAGFIQSGLVRQSVISTAGSDQKRARPLRRSTSILMPVTTLSQQRSKSAYRPRFPMSISSPTSRLWRSRPCRLFSLLRDWRRAHIREALPTRRCLGRLSTC
jgi:hypothetical protein